MFVHACLYVCVVAIHIQHDYMHIPYSMKVWRTECLVNLPFSSIWRKKFGEWISQRAVNGNY